MSFLTFEGLPTTFEGSLNVSYSTALLTFVAIGANAWTYKLQHVYKVRNFFIKLLGIYKLFANVMDKDHKITNLHHSVA